MEKANPCCQPAPDRHKKGILKGLLYGLAPHTFCIGFIAFSIIGVTSASAVFKKFLLIPYFFQFSIALSFVFATVSAVIYLKKVDCLCLDGIKNKYKYISILYATTILTNLALFFFVFPALANTNPNGQTNQNDLLASLSLKVQIPCSGHAPLIIDELKNNGKVDAVTFRLPDIFEIKYNSKKTSQEKIADLEIFKTYKATTQ